jgi:hypothetical protein
VGMRVYWLLFAVVQAVGAILPKLPNVGSKILLFAGLLLLFPGDFLASVFSGKLSLYIFYPAVFLINAGAWFILRKMLLLNTESSVQSKQ